MANGGDNLGTVLAAWGRMIRTGTVDGLTGLLHPDAVWVGIEPGEICRNRDEVVYVLTHRAAFPRPTRIEAQELGDSVVVGFEAPDLPEPRWLVIAFEEGKVVRMQSVTDRDLALRLAAG